MRKIQMNVNEKDRIKADHQENNLIFYYKPDKEDHWIFTGKNLRTEKFFAGSGKTIRELYQFHYRDNKRMRRTAERIPSVIESCLKYDACRTLSDGDTCYVYKHAKEEMTSGWRHMDRSA